MSTAFKVQLTPTSINPNSEGSLDTAIIAGVSIQRTAYIEVCTGSYPFNKVILEANDGSTFSTNGTAVIPTACPVTVVNGVNPTSVTSPTFADIVATN